MTQTSARLGQFRPSPTVSMSALVRKLRAEGRDIIGLVGGEPDFATPEPIKQAGIRAIQNNETRYTDVDGTPALRRAIVRQVQARERPGLHARADRRLQRHQAVAARRPAGHDRSGRRGDHPRAALGLPPRHRAHRRRRPRLRARATPKRGFRLAPEALEAAITPRTRVLILNSPNNPTGTAYQADELLALAAVLKRHPEIWVLTDEIYEHIRFDDRPVPSLAALDPEMKERTVTANGLSKGYVMTGWRIGFAGGPAAMMKAIQLIIGQLVGPPNAIAQAAAIEALDGDQGFIADNARIFQERRDIALQILQQTPGLRCHVPEGAFYLYADCSGTIGKTLPDGKVIETDEDFVLGSIEHAGVALVPGAAFGPVAVFPPVLLAGHGPVAHGHGAAATLLQRADIGVCRRGLYVGANDQGRPDANRRRTDPRHP